MHMHMQSLKKIFCQHNVSHLGPSRNSEKKNFNGKIVFENSVGIFRCTVARTFGIFSKIVPSHENSFYLILFYFSIKNKNNDAVNEIRTADPKK